MKKNVYVLQSILKIEVKCFVKLCSSVQIKKYSQVTQKYTKTIDIQVKYAKRFPSRHLY